MFYTNRRSLSNRVNDAGLASTAARIRPPPCRPQVFRKHRERSCPSAGQVREKNDPGVEALHVIELHPDGSSVAENMDVARAPDERVHVDLVHIDQPLL